MIRLGLRLRDFPSENLTWRDLAVIVRCAPADSPLARVMEPSVAGQIDVQLLRSIDYSLRWLSWAKTKDGQAGRNRPEWVTFDWEKPARGADGYRGDTMELEEAADWLGWSDLIEAENTRRSEAGLPLIGAVAGKFVSG